MIIVSQLGKLGTRLPSSVSSRQEISNSWKQLTTQLAQLQLLTAVRPAPSAQRTQPAQLQLLTPGSASSVSLLASRCSPPFGQLRQLNELSLLSSSCSHPVRPAPSARSPPDAHRRLASSVSSKNSACSSPCFSQLYQLKTSPHQTATSEANNKLYPFHHNPHHQLNIHWPPTNINLAARHTILHTAENGSTMEGEAGKGCGGTDLLMREVAERKPARMRAPPRRRARSMLALGSRCATATMVYTLSSLYFFSSRTPPAVFTLEILGTTTTLVLAYARSLLALGNGHHCTHPQLYFFLSRTSPAAFTLNRNRRDAGLSLCSLFAYTAQQPHPQLIGHHCTHPQLYFFLFRTPPTAFMLDILGTTVTPGSVYACSLFALLLVRLAHLEGLRHSLPDASSSTKGALRMTDTAPSLARILPVYLGSLTLVAAKLADYYHALVSLSPRPPQESLSPTGEPANVGWGPYGDAHLSLDLAGLL
ncbi:hypothetical protein PtB15_3B393 [Puccinia triticina]|nr:hypothetical protein PtB15_3B393 [Puccinia triticina]